GPGRRGRARRMLLTGRVPGPRRAALQHRGDGAGIRGGLRAAARPRLRCAGPLRCRTRRRVSTTAVVLIGWRVMAAAPLLEIDDLHVAVDGSEILRGLSLTVAD